MIDPPTPSQPAHRTPGHAGDAWTVTPGQAPVRLDAELARRLDLTRSQVRRLLESGAVRVDGRKQSERHKGTLLTAGQAVAIEAFTRPEDARPIAQPELPLRVLAEKPGVVIVDKPAGVPVHPLDPAETGTMLNALAARFPDIHTLGEQGLRGGVVHRLDVETSGTLALATSHDAFTQLREAFARHTAVKTYRAVVKGRLTGEHTETLTLHIAQHRPAIVRVLKPAREKPPSSARRCTLHWRALESLRDATLLEVQLETGFLHQIRATFAHLGHPVLGDTLYQGPPAPRLMLHASRLVIAGLDAQSPDPAEFAAALRSLRS